MSEPPLVDEEAVEDVMKQLRTSVEDKGLEVSPFKVSRYNARVEAAFRFRLHADTLAVLVVSTPSMFEKLFLPSVMGDEKSMEGSVDPLDRCIRAEMDTLTGLFPQYRVEFIQDSQLTPTRRPVVLVQTAGHVSGAAYYYQRADVAAPQPWSENTRIYGVSVHPRYGGWFALRGVLIFHGLLAPGLVQRAPIDCVPSREGRVELLEKFNTCWQDYSYREVMESGTIVERYSDRQRTYFSTVPRNRFELIQQWRKGGI